VTAPLSSDDEEWVGLVSARRVAVSMVALRELVDRVGDVDSTMRCDEAMVRLLVAARAVLVPLEEAVRPRCAARGAFGRCLHSDRPHDSHTDGVTRWP
jgi:hypothetical protein